MSSYSNTRYLTPAIPLLRTPSTGPHCDGALDSGHPVCRLHAEFALGSAEAHQGKAIDGRRRLCAVLLCLAVCPGRPVAGVGDRWLSDPGNQRAVSAVLRARRGVANPVYVPAGLSVFTAQLRRRHDLFENRSHAGCSAGFRAAG